MKKILVLSHTGYSFEVFWKSCFLASGTKSDEDMPRTHYKEIAQRVFSQKPNQMLNAPTNKKGLQP